MNVTLTYKSEIIFYHGPRSEVNRKPVFLFEVHFCNNEFLSIKLSRWVIVFALCILELGFRGAKSGNSLSRPEVFTNVMNAVRALSREKARINCPSGPDGPPRTAKEQNKQIACTEIQAVRMVILRSNCFVNNIPDHISRLRVQLFIKWYFPRYAPIGSI